MLTIAQHKIFNYRERKDQNRDKAGTIGPWTLNPAINKTVFDLYHVLPQPTTTIKMRIGNWLQL